jgi:hypothetical protein
MLRASCAWPSSWRISIVTATRPAVSLGGTGTIAHIVDNTGSTVNSSGTVAYLASYN